MNTNEHKRGGKRIVSTAWTRRPARVVRRTRCECRSGVRTGSRVPETRWRRRKRRRGVYDCSARFTPAGPTRLVHFTRVYSASALAKLVQCTVFVIVVCPPIVRRSYMLCPSSPMLLHDP